MLSADSSPAGKCSEKRATEESMLTTLHAENSTFLRKGSGMIPLSEGVTLTRDSEIYLQPSAVLEMQYTIKYTEQGKGENFEVL